MTEERFISFPLSHAHCEQKRTSVALKYSLSDRRDYLMTVCRQSEFPAEVQPPKKHIHMLSASVDVPWTPLLCNATHTIQTSLLWHLKTRSHGTRHTGRDWDLHSKLTHRCQNEPAEAIGSRTHTHYCRGQRAQTGWWLGGVQWDHTQHKHKFSWLSWV